MNASIIYVCRPSSLNHSEMATRIENADYSHFRFNCLPWLTELAVKYYNTQFEDIKLRDMGERIPDSYPGGQLS
jgi:NDP-sugar pyrophosphorylase family protein